MGATESERLSELISHSSKNRLDPHAYYILHVLINPNRDSRRIFPLKRSGFVTVEIPDRER